MKIISVLAAVLILVNGLSGFTGCAVEEIGSLPQFALGDKWVSRWVTGGETYTVTAEITGSDTVDGQDCWVMETTFDPAYMNEITSMTTKYEKTDLNIVYTSYSYVETNKFTTYSYRTEGDPFYPLKIGKEISEIKYATISTGDEMITQTQNTTTKTYSKVEKIEDITTEAGKFSCFKVLKYDSEGTLISVSWRSNKTKLFQVKMQDMAEEDATYELISYTVH